MVARLAPTEQSGVSHGDKQGILIRPHNCYVTADEFAETWPRKRSVLYVVNGEGLFFMHRNLRLQVCRMTARIQFKTAISEL